jgi:hypothetical protein
MELKKMKNKRVRIDVRWTSKGKPYVWDFYHYLINWCDSFTKTSGQSELTILKDFCSYHFLIHRNWDNIDGIIIICNNYHHKEFRKLQVLIRKWFKRYKPKFEKPTLF